MKRFFKALLLGAGILTAISPQVAKSSDTGATIQRQIKNDIVTYKKQHHVRFVGGLPLVTEVVRSSFGMTPKEYGIRYGNGACRKCKSNKKHRSHLHKIKSSKI